MKGYGWIGLSMAVGTIVLLTLPARAKPGLFVELRLAKQRYFLGEAIPFQLCYWSTIAGRYRLDLATYDRSGRLPNERFQVVPASGWRDPLRTYLESGLPAMMGGLRSHAVLAAKPACIPLWLDDWVRFEKPGRYRIAVGSARVNMTDRPSGPTLRAVSAAAELDMVAAPDGWEKATLRDVLTKIDAANEWLIPSEAVRGLAALRTPEALRAMVERVPKIGGLGLIAWPDSAEVTRAIEGYMAEPSAPIEGMHIAVWAALKVLAERPVASRSWIRYDVLKREGAKTAARAIKAKRGEAWAQTRDAIAAIDPALAPRVALPAREDVSQLSDGELRWVLQERGDEIRDPVWWDTLKERLVAAPSPVERSDWTKWFRLTRELIRRMRRLDAANTRDYCARKPDWRQIWEQIEKEP